MLGKVVGAAALVGLGVVLVQAGEDDLATVEYTACLNIPVPYHLHVPDRSLYLPSNGTPLAKGRVYELTYVVGDGRITASRDIREATCNG